MPKTKEYQDSLDACLAYADAWLASEAFNAADKAIADFFRQHPTWSPEQGRVLAELQALHAALEKDFNKAAKIARKWAARPRNPALIANPALTV